MKQYDKIWIPEKKQRLAFRDSEGDTPSILAGPVIVLTIEEAKELFRAGMSFERDKDNSFVTALGFDNYMKTKGLTIKQQ